MGFGKDGKGAIIKQTATVVLLGMGDQTVKKLSALVFQEDFRLLKSEIFAHVRGLTSPEGVGLLLGICNGELTEAEIAESLVANAPLDRNDRVGEERSMRMVQLFAGLRGDGGGTILQFIGKEGGPMMTIKPRWTFSDPEGWTYFVYNGTGAAITTGATAELEAAHFGVWVT